MLSLVLSAHQAPGQAPFRVVPASRDAIEPAAEVPDSADWKVWASLSLLGGGIRSPEYSRSKGANAGTVALWLTYHRLALSVRSMGMPIYVDETRGVGDRAILAGVHLPAGRKGDFVLAVGGGQSAGVGYLVPANAEGMFAAAAELNANYRFVGVGLEAMAGVGSSRRYAAAGVAFALGWFQ